MGKRTKKADQKPNEADFKDLESIESISDNNGEVNDAPVDQATEPELKAEEPKVISDEQVKAEAELSAEVVKPEKKSNSFMNMLKAKQAERNAAYLERVKKNK